MVVVICGIFAYLGLSLVFAVLLLGVLENIRREIKRGNDNSA